MNLQLISSILATLGSIFLVISYVPQIRQLFKTKQTEGMSVSFWVVLILGLVFTTTNMILNSNPMSVLLPQFLNITLATVVLIQIIVYRRKK